jgi:carboxymethylenebutenolidase
VPTGRFVVVPIVTVIGMRDGLVDSEHIYWDQATVLMQAGLIDGEKLPISDAESARKILDPASVPSNGLLHR